MLEPIDPFRLSPIAPQLGECFASRTGGTKRGGATTAPKTTARAGTTKSAKSRARLHSKMSDSAGAADQSPGEHRTIDKPARAERTKRGPGDAGKAHGSRDRQGRQGAPKRAK
jgi:hypothetical protein